MKKTVVITNATMCRIGIPFLLDFAHAKASRSSADSLILRLSGPDGEGFGEAILRDYVSGRLGTGADILEAAARAAERILRPLTGRALDWDGIESYLLGIALPPEELPILCAVESALISLFCLATGRDIYQLLGREPLRRVVSYGAVLPMTNDSDSDRMLKLIIGLGIPYLRIKVGSDLEYSRRTLTRVRSMLGDDFDVRVDVNADWSLEDAVVQLPLLQEYGISRVEEPFGKGSPFHAELISRPESDGITFIADESVLSREDVDSIAQEGIFTMLNLRLSKNGGLLRVLELAGESARLGLRYQIGCHVGETGILSAMGRAAACLLPDPIYSDGSYDRFLLSGNITAEDITFGPKGMAPVLRGNGIGITVDPGKLSRFLEEERRCW